MDCDRGRDGGGKGSFSALSWLALRTEFGLLPLREGPSPSLWETDAGLSTKRDIKLSSSALLSARLGIGEMIYFLSVNRIETQQTHNGSLNYL
jgi:hypothetical protein